MTDLHREPPLNASPHSRMGEENEICRPFVSVKNPAVHFFPPYSPSRFCSVHIFCSESQCLHQKFQNNCLQSVHFSGFLFFVLCGKIHFDFNQKKQKLHKLLSILIYLIFEAKLSVLSIHLFWSQMIPRIPLFTPPEQFLSFK